MIIQRDQFQIYILYFRAWILDPGPLEYKEHLQRWTWTWSTSSWTTICKKKHSSDSASASATTCIDPRRGRHHRKWCRTRGNPCPGQCLDQQGQNPLQLSSSASASPGEAEMTDKMGQSWSGSNYKWVNLSFKESFQVVCPPCHWHRAEEWSTQSPSSPHHCKSFRPLLFYGLQNKREIYRNLSSVLL